VITSYFNGVAFAWPGALWLLAIVPLHIWWYIKPFFKMQASLPVSSINQVKQTATWKTIFRHVPFILRMLTIACLIVALARPQLRNDEQMVTGEGIDIVLCVDVSGSMLAQDFTPNRMEAAKQVAADFVDARPTDRIAVVIFSGESFTLTPLTTDNATLKAQIFNIQSGLLVDGTAIGSGLATSVDRLKASASKTKIVILLTDGENNGGDIGPLTAKEIAKSIGVRVYTIGVGTDGFASVPQRSSSGIVTMQKEKVNIDEKLLTQIATETGGKYFRAKDNESLKNIYSEIDKLEKTRVEISALKRYTEKFLPLAIAAIIFLLIEMVLRYTIFKRFP
jgi:Ca-activated chloride channel homolog